MNSLNELSKREPLPRNAAIGAILTTILVWLRTMGYIEWTEEQFAITEELVLMVADAILWIILLLQPRFAKEIVSSVEDNKKMSVDDVALLIENLAVQQREQKDAAKPVGE